MLRAAISSGVMIISTSGSRRGRPACATCPSWTRAGTEPALAGARPRGPTPWLGDRGPRHEQEGGHVRERADHQLDRVRARSGPDGDALLDPDPDEERAEPDHREREHQLDEHPPVPGHAPWRQDRE